MKIVWEVWIQIVSIRLREGAETPEYEGTEPPPHTGELFRVSVFVDSGGLAPLNSPAVVNFCLHFSHLFFSSTSTFKRKKKKKSVVVRIKTVKGPLNLLKTLQGWRKPVRTDRPLGGVRGWLRDSGIPWILGSAPSGEEGTLGG